MKRHRMTTTEAGYELKTMGEWKQDDQLALWQQQELGRKAHRFPPHEGAYASRLARRATRELGFLVVARKLEFVGA